MSPQVQRIALVIVAMLIAGGVLLRVRNAIRETTLVSAWWWTWGATWIVGFVELHAARLPADTSSTLLTSLRLIAGLATLCPALALMGAKRPQDWAWNWVVLALWGLLLLPVGVTWFRPTATPLATYGPLAYLLWVLISLGFVNLVPTRFWPVAFTLTAGQTLYIADHLPLLPAWGQWHTTVGIGLLSASLPLAAMLARMPTPSHVPLDRVWRDFRDTFGLFWALRVQERVNDVAVKLAWPVRLGWSGFVSADDGATLSEWPTQIEGAVRQNLHGLLRRFVSPAWLQERWGNE